MLPERVRTMRQMQEVLNVEDMILLEIEETIDTLYDRASLLHEELVNESWLENKLGQLTGYLVSAEKCKDQLKVNFSISTDKIGKAKEAITLAFIDKWLPAHLAYDIVYEKSITARNYLAAMRQEDEIIVIREVTA